MLSTLWHWFNLFLVRKAIINFEKNHLISRAFMRTINISDQTDSTGNRKRTFKSSHAYRLGESFGVEWYALLHARTHTRETKGPHAARRHLLVSIVNFGLIVYSTTIRFHRFPIHCTCEIASSRIGQFFNLTHIVALILLSTCHIAYILYFVLIIIIFAIIYTDTFLLY